MKTEEKQNEKQSPGSIVGYDPGTPEGDHEVMVFGHKTPEGDLVIDDILDSEGLKGR